MRPFKYSTLPALACMSLGKFDHPGQTRVCPRTWMSWSRHHSTAFAVCGGVVIQLFSQPGHFKAFSKTTQLNPWPLPSRSRIFDSYVALCFGLPAKRLETTADPKANSCCSISASTMAPGMGLPATSCTTKVRSAFRICSMRLAASARQGASGSYPPYLSLFDLLGRSSILRSLP